MKSLPKKLSFINSKIQKVARIIHTATPTYRDPNRIYSLLNGEIRTEKRVISNCSAHFSFLAVIFTWF